MPPLPVRAVLLTLLCAVGGACAEPASDAGNEEDFSVADFPEDSQLPYAGEWLDPPKALAGISQFDRLKTTIHDDAKCSTMVAIAAAIVGGRDHFVALVDEVARLRKDRADDLAVIDRVRRAIDEKKLTPRHLHELTEALVRAYKVAHGAFDEQIEAMVLASGYEAVHVGSIKPHVLVDHLAEGEVVPLSIVAENIPHITLLWKDKRGVVRLYDSDQLRSHVFPRGSKGYNFRMDDPQSAWDLAKKYR